MPAQAAKPMCVPTVALSLTFSPLGFLSASHPRLRSLVLIRSHGPTIYWYVGLNEETTHVSLKLISVSPHDSVTQAHHLVFRLISTEHSCPHLLTLCAPAATGPSSSFPECRRGSRVCGVTRASLVRMYRLPVSERRNLGPGSAPPTGVDMMNLV